MRPPVQRNASIGAAAVLLVVDRHEAGRLHDPAVGAGGRRMTERKRQAHSETSIVRRPVFGAISGAASGSAHEPARCPLLTGWGERRNLPVRWIYDERRPLRSDDALCPRP